MDVPESLAGKKLSRSRRPYRAPGGRTLPLLVLAVLLAAAMLAVVPMTYAQATTTTMSATLPTARSSTSAIWDGANAYVVGGTPGSGALNQIVGFNPATSTVTTMSGTLPTARGITSGVWDGTNAYIFGGYAVGGPLNQIVRYNPTANSVTTMSASLPTARYATSAVWDGDNAYIFGGIDGSGQILNQIVRYNPAANMVTLMTATLPTERHGTSTVWDGSNVYIFGGYDLAGKLNQIVRYNPDSNTASVMSATLPTARESTSAVWDGSNAYIFGGTDASGLLNQIVRYSPSSDTATVMGATLPTARGDMSAVWDGANAYIFGGHDASGTLNQIVRYNPVSSNTPSSSSASSSPPPSSSSSSETTSGPAAAHPFTVSVADLPLSVPPGGNFNVRVTFSGADEFSSDHLGAHFGPDHTASPSAATYPTACFHYAGIIPATVQVQCTAPIQPGTYYLRGHGRTVESGTTFNWWSSELSFMVSGTTTTNSSTTTSGSATSTSSSNSTGQSDPCSNVTRAGLTFENLNNSVVALATDKGCIVAELYDEKAPITVTNFKTYANEKFFDGTLFHRIIKDFMIQTGGMNASGNFKTANHPPIKNEAATSGLNNLAYTLAMSRTSDADSATNQFFINMADNPNLDSGSQSAGFAVFGHVVHGKDVVDAIASVPVTNYSSGKHCQPGSPPSCPTIDVVLLSARLIDYPTTPTSTSPQSLPIMFIHGIDPSGSAGASGEWWSAAKSALAFMGLESSPMVTWGYYDCDTGYDAFVDEGGSHLKHPGVGRTAEQNHAGTSCRGGHNRDTAIEHLAYHWAWAVYDRYQSQAPTSASTYACVDVVAHSMGGLIVRHALERVQQGDEDFPPTLCVKKIVTLGTPFGGTDLDHLGGFCDYYRLTASYQCLEMNPGHPFTSSKKGVQLPTDDGNTRWTVIGSDADTVVAAASAVDVTPAQQIRYLAKGGIGHFEDCCWYGAQTGAELSAYALYSDDDETWRLSYSMAWPVRRAGVSLSMQTADWSPSNCGYGYVAAITLRSSVPVTVSTLPAAENTCTYFVHVPEGTPVLRVIETRPRGNDLDISAYFVPLSGAGEDACRPPSKQQGICEIEAPSPGQWAVTVRYTDRTMPFTIEADYHSASQDGSGQIGDKATNPASSAGLAAMLSVLVACTVHRRRLSH